MFPIEENRKKQNQFVAAASHELRTPLAVILSCTEAMLEKPDIEPFAHDLSTVKSEALRMSSLIQDLLTLSSRDANHFPIQKASTELDTLLLDAYEAFEAMAHTKQLKISVTLPEDIIPPCYCDKQRIYQVIAILLHNAISYTPNGGKITLALTMQEKYFALSISDTGVTFSKNSSTHCSISIFNLPVFPHCILHSCPAMPCKSASDDNALPFPPPPQSAPPLTRVPVSLPSPLFAPYRPEPFRL